MRRRIRSAALPVHRHALPQVALDAGLVALAYFLAYRLRFDGGVPTRYEDLFSRTITFAICGSVATFALFGLYRHWMRYSSQREYLQIAQAVAVSVFALVGYVAVVQPKLISTPGGRRVGDDPDRRARALRAADARLHRRGALRDPPRLRAAAARLPRPPRRALGADRRRRRRRPAAAARDPAQPRPRLPPRRLRRRRRAQAAPAGRPRARGARHQLRARARARRRRARRGADRHPLGAGHPARARGQRLPRPRRPGAHDADRLRAAPERLPARAPGARGARGGRARPRAGADGDRADRRLPDRPVRAGHRRRRLDRRRAVPPDLARRARAR